jgi:hypothetical protein
VAREDSADGWASTCALPTRVTAHLAHQPTHLSPWEAAVPSVALGRPHSWTLLSLPREPEIWGHTKVSSPGTLQFRVTSKPLDQTG